jgi:IS5 family transposase
LNHNSIPPGIPSDSLSVDNALAESLRVAHDSGALRTRDLARVTVDTTVQPKHVSFPTDAKLLHASIKGLNRLATSTGSNCGNPTSVSPGTRR